uniref:Putative tick salivary peptide group 1 n=1 Tax=Ixodes ricinus TaxID=34613 RepID=V5HBN4_IXORI
MQAVVLILALVGIFFVKEANSACPKYPNITSCNFYCPDGKGGWEKDYLDDGAPCNYNSEKDGECRGGSCWLIESEIPTEPTNPVNYPDTNPSSKPKKTKSKKKKYVLPK